MNLASFYTLFVVSVLIEKSEKLEDERIFVNSKSGEQDIWTHCLFIVECNGCVITLGSFLPALHRKAGRDQKFTK